MESHFKDPGAFSPSQCEINDISFNKVVQEDTSSTSDTQTIDTIVDWDSGESTSQSEIEHNTEVSQCNLPVVTHTDLSSESCSPISYSTTQADVEVHRYGSSDTQVSDTVFDWDSEESTSQSEGEYNTGISQCNVPVVTCTALSSESYLPTSYSTTQADLEVNRYGSTSPDCRKKNSDKSFKKGDYSLPQSQRDNRSMKDLHNEGINFRPLSSTNVPDHLNQRDAGCQLTVYIPDADAASSSLDNMEGAVGGTSPEKKKCPIRHAVLLQVDRLRNPTENPSKGSERYYYIGELQHPATEGCVPTYSTTWIREESPRTESAPVLDITGYSPSTDSDDNYEQLSHGELRCMAMDSKRDVRERLPRPPLLRQKNVIERVRRVKLLQRQYANFSFGQSFESGVRMWFGRSMMIL